LDKKIAEGEYKKRKRLTPLQNVPYGIPENWVWEKLGNIVFDMAGGGTPSKSEPKYWNGRIPWASVKDIKMNERDLISTKDFITEEGLNNSSSRIIPENNILIVTRMGLGKVQVNKINVAINQDIKGIIVGIIDPDYLFLVLKNQSFTGSGMTVKGIKIDELNNLPIPIPPLEEQKRIVRKVNELNILCQDLIDKIGHKEKQSSILSTTVIGYTREISRMKN